MIKNKILGAIGILLVAASSLIMAPNASAVVNGSSVTVSGTTTCNNGSTERTVAGTMTTTCGSGWSVGNLVPKYPTFGPQSSTFATDNGFDFAETFDGLADWERSVDSAGNYDATTSLARMPKLSGGGTSALDYFSNYVSITPADPWIAAYGDGRVWRGTKSATIDIGTTGKGPSRLGLYMGDGYTDVYIFFMVKIPNNAWPTSCVGGNCSAGTEGTYTEGNPYEYWAAWKFFTPQLGCPSASCHPYSPIWNWIIGIQKYNYGVDPGVTFMVTDNDHVADDWMRKSDGNAKNLDARIGQWMGVEYRIRTNSTETTMDAWVYDSAGNVTVVGEGVTKPTPQDAIDANARINQFFFGGNNSGSYTWGPTMDSSYNIDDIIVDDQRIGPKYFDCIGVTAGGSC